MQATQKHGEKIFLFVDNDQVALEVGSLMLQKLGYSVITASKRQEAIEIFKKNDVAFVILDMRIPGMNGDEICRQLKKIKPKTKILLASGSRGVYSEMDLTRIGFDGFIQKPFGLEQLSENIEDL